MEMEPRIPELLPELIQTIQSLLNNKEAAQTSLVSKSWYKVWCTRPVVYLLGRDHFDAIGFWDYATMTVLRCIDLNVKVDRLTLIIPFNYQASLIDNLVLHISDLRVNTLKLSFHDKNHLYVLPAQVLANNKMTELYLASCEVGNLIPTNVVCSNLRSLSLFHVSIEDSVFKGILVRSPIIENLSLVRPRDLKTIDARDLCNLKNLIVKGVIVLESTGSPSLVICGRFLSLSSMVLIDVNVDVSFFANLSSRFPKLEELTLERLNYDKNMRISNLIISSNSVKRLSLKHSHISGGMWDMANFDVPNIRKFKFSGDYIPPLSITSASEECESEIDLSKRDEIVNVSRLRELRRKLGRSKISLQLRIYHDSGVFPERSFEDFNLPGVEELTYNVLQSRLAYNLFIECVLSCRPKIVYYLHRFVALAIPILYKEFIKQKKNLDTATYGTSFMNNLMEVSVECLEDSLKQWQPLKSSPDALEIQNYRVERLRLKLKWESPTPEQTIINFIDD